MVKKRHTVKNNLIGDVEDRLVRYLSETSPGRVHDKHICDAEEPVFPSNIGLFQDSPPYTFFLLNGDIELNRNRQLFI